MRAALPTATWCASVAEVARALAFSAALLMVISFTIWTSRLRGPLLQRLDGVRASNVAPAALAMKLLIVSFGMSVVAAILAIVPWISP
jgi:hypothetical protein